MRLITLDPLRTLDVPGTRPLKPEQMFRESELIKSADWVLFPEYWQVNALVYAWKKKIFPSINTYHMGHDKVELSRALQALCPGNVPQTLILPRTPSSEEVILDQLCFPMVAKEVRNSIQKLNGAGCLPDRGKIRLEKVYPGERYPVPPGISANHT